MRNVWPVIEGKAALHWVMMSGIHCTNWRLELPGCSTSAESYEKLLQNKEISLVHFIHNVALEIPLQVEVIRNNPKRIKSIKYLVQQGANMEAKTTRGGWTILIWASKFGKLEIVQCLVNLGADKEAKAEKGWFPLYVAAEHGHLDIVKYLVEQGADKEAKATNGLTSIGIAATEKKFDVVKYLMEQDGHYF